MGERGIGKSSATYAQVGQRHLTAVRNFSTINLEDARRYKADGRDARPFSTARSETMLIIRCHDSIARWDEAVRHALAASLQDVAADSGVELVVLTGPRAFEAPVVFDDHGRVVQADILDLTTALAASAKPVLAAVCGAARGAGLEAALACDFRIAAAEATFAMPEIELGLLPINGGLERLSALLGLDDIADILAFGKTLSAVQALRAGLLDYVVEGDLVQVALRSQFRIKRTACGRGAPPVRRDQDDRDDRDVALMALGKRLRAAAPGRVAHRALMQALEHAGQVSLRRSVLEARALSEQCAQSEQADALAYAYACDRAVGAGADDPVLQARLRWTLLREAIHIVDAGSTPGQVDRALTAFGFTDPPFLAADRRGLLSIPGEGVSEDSAWRIYSPTVDLMAGAGRLGVQGSLGWYRYGRPGDPPQVDPSLERLLGESAMAQRLHRRSLSQDEIINRCAVAMVNGAAALLERHEADGAAQIDACWNRLGFPRWRGGLLYHADRWGLKTVDTVLRTANATRATLGPPSALLSAWISADEAAAPWPLD